MSHSKSQAKEGVDKSRVAGQRMLGSTNLRGGRFAPRWLYFLFYLFCRRQQKFPGKSLNPTLAAMNGLGAVMAIPWLIVILTIDYYFPFLRSLSDMWSELGLPGNGNKPWGYVLISTGLITGIGLQNLLFGGQYKKIMNFFSSYDRNEHDFAPGVMLSFVWFVILGVSSYAAIDYMSRPSNMLFWATLTNISIFIIAELFFRLWWRRCVESL